MGRILPESIGADKSLFEDKPDLGENENLNNSGIFQTQSINSSAERDDHSSLNINLAQIESSLDIGLQDNDTKITDIDDLSPTSFKINSVLDTTSFQSSADTLPVQDSQAVPDSHSVSDSQLVDVSLTESGTEAICTKFGLDPKKLQVELKEVFSNLSQLIKILAPGFTNIYPSLDNLLKLVCRISKALETNSIDFAGKTLVFFDYYISANDQINFELHYNRITISNKEPFVLEPFESKNLDFQFMAYLPQIWELKQYICTDSSILQ